MKLFNRNKAIFTALSPNAQRDDIFLAFKLLFMPWLWRNGTYIKAFSKAFAGRFNFKHVFLFESGRTCLYAILSSLKLSKNDEVLVQAYTCVAVPEPILWCGLRPVYVDCDEETLNMSVDDLENKITSRSKVLIIQHTFGNPADLDRLISVAGKHHLFVIEDCAHALGSRYHEKAVGTYGDAAFFSFGRDKVISSVFGGALAINDDELAEKIAEFSRNCKNISYGWIFQQLLHPVILGLVKCTYGILIGKVILKLAKRMGLISRAVYKEEKQGLKPSFISSRMPNAMAKMALNQFRKLDMFNSHRRVLAEFYKEHLKNCFSKTQLECKGGRSIYLRYVIRTGHQKEILRIAAFEDIYLGDWYTTAVAPEGVDYDKIGYDPKSCPVAEKLALETVNLPTDNNTGLSDAKRIVAFLRKYYGNGNKGN